VNGETGSSVEPADADREVDGSPASGRESSMRTVLCSTTAGRRAFLLALVAGMAGAVALPATSADAAASSGGRHAGVHAGIRDGVAVLGPAVKYVRSSDGSIRRVR